MSNLSSNVLYIGNLPWQWDIEVVKSVIKGSGRVVDVRYKSDRKKSFCFIEYLTPEDAARALELLGQVRYGGSGNGKKKLRIELSKEGLKKKNQHSDKPVLQLTREYLPVDVKLPDGILSDEEKIAYKRNDGNVNFGNNNGNGSNNANMHNNSNGAFGASHEFPMPQHLLQASNNLPPINKTYFNADSKVSQNLEAIAPNQIIQLVANLKNLLINNDFNSAASILKLSPQLTIAVAQALLLMGFVDNDVITQAATAASAASNNNTPFGGNIPGAGTPVPPPAPINNFQLSNNNNNLQPYSINNDNNNINNNNNNNNNNKDDDN